MLAGILAFPTLSLWLLSDSSIVPRERKALYSQATVPGIGLVGGSSSSVTLDIERYTERGRQRAVKELVETWRTRLNNFGVSEPKITELEANLFNIIVPINMKSQLTKRIISEPGSITLHLFKDGIDVQKLRGRIDEILHEKYNLESVKSNMLENVSFSSLLSSISMEDGISDIVVKESNIADVKQILADRTVRETIRAFNLANPPAGEFVWASQSIERGGIKYYPLYFINLNPIHEAYQLGINERNQYHLFELPNGQFPKLVDTHREVDESTITKIPISFWSPKKSRLKFIINNNTVHLKLIIAHPVRYIHNLNY